MTRRLSNSLLWEGFVADDVVGLANGALMRSYRLAPTSVEGVTKVERLALASRHSNSYRRLSDSVGLHVEEQNVPADQYAPPCKWPSAASALLDAERERDCLAFGRQFEPAHFLTVTSRPRTITGTALKRWLLGGKIGDRRELDDELSEFRQQCADVESALAGVASLRAMGKDETCRYLYSTVSHRWQRVLAACHENLAMQLGTEPFEPRWRVSRLGEQHVEMICLSGFDAGTHPHVLEGLRVRFPYRRVARWRPIGRAEARAMLNSRQSAAGMEIVGVREAARMEVEKTDRDREAFRDKAAEMRALQFAEAQAGLESRGYGELSPYFVVWANSKAECKARAEILRREITGRGIVCKSEVLSTWGTWLGTLPGHLDAGARKMPVTTRAFADLVPSTRRWAGARFDKTLAKATGVKSPWMFTADPAPFRITTDVPGGAAHSVVLGGAGSGKSSFINQLALLFYRWGRVISISVGCSELGPCLLSGGAVYYVAEGKSPLQFQPLARIDEPEQMRVAAEWLELAFTAMGTQITPQRRKALQEALQLRARDNPRQRTITALRSDLKSREPELYRALQPFSREGHYGHIFDGDNAAALGWKPWTMFDIRALLTATIPAWVVTPAIAHTLHLIREQFGKGPLLLLMDEVPRWLHDSSLQDLLLDVLDTRRKDEVRALITAQTPAQFAEHKRLMGSLLSAARTRFFGRDTAAQSTTTAAQYAEFGLTAAEIEHISTMPQGSYLYKSFADESPVTRTFETNAGPIALTLAGMTHTERDLPVLANLWREAHGDPDAMLRALLRARGLEDKAKELQQWKMKRERAA
jgi:type IV secretion system protein VirB4